jgi:hypothetical protein
MNKVSEGSPSKVRRAAGTLSAALLLMTFSVSSHADIFTDVDPAELEISPHLIEEALLDDELAREIQFQPWYAEASDLSNYRNLQNPEALNSGFSVCADCEVQVGVGGTYHSFGATGGVVIPVTVSWDQSRWEFGVFHFTEQSSSDNEENVERIVARPYWGASLSRRFPFFERGPIRAIFGFGVSYRTEQDILSSTHWNFSSQLGLRFQSPEIPVIVELSARHWSNGGVRTPNRGQDFTILTVRFDR